MTSVRLTKRSIDDILPNGSEFTVWDTDLTGFGLRVRENGVKSYVVVYRSGHGRKAPVRRLTICRVGKVTHASVVFPPSHFAGIGRQVRPGDMMVNTDFGAAQAREKRLRLIGVGYALLNARSNRWPPPSQDEMTRRLSV
jgi:hypothetical protein